jgi:hypothetical protein
MALSLRYVVVDGCPVPRLLAKRIKLLKKDVPGAVLQSCYRGKDAERLLHKHGKHSQAELYAGWRARRPGFNPANPPGRSSHELRSDGVAYEGPVGRRLPWWCCGMDFNDAAVPKLIEAARRRGWGLRRPYSSGSEYHHLNFTHKPRIR